MQVRVMLVVGVPQKRDAAENSKNQNRDEYRCEHATHNPQPHEAVESGAAGVGRAVRHGRKWYRP
jgi:hypothetical protein